MKQTIVVKLIPSADQHAALLATMKRFNTACNHIAGAAFERRMPNNIALQKRVYYQVRERFGLSSQLTVRAIAKVVEAYKRDKTVQPAFRPHGAVCYDQRVMSGEGVGLATHLAVRAIAKVVEAYKRDKTVQPAFRPHGAVCYDQRIMSWKGVE